MKKRQKTYLEEKNAELTQQMNEMNNQNNQLKQKMEKTEKKLEKSEKDIDRLKSHLLQLETENSNQIENIQQQLNESQTK